MLNEYHMTLTQPGGLSLANAPLHCFVYGGIFSEKIFKAYLKGMGLIIRTVHGQQHTG